MLREKDQKAVLCRGLGSVKRAMKEVVSQNLRYAVMMGTNELPLLKQSRILVKDMSSREQKEVIIDDFVHSCQSYRGLLGQPSRLQKWELFCPNQKSHVQDDNSSCGLQGSYRELFSSRKDRE